MANTVFDVLKDKIEEDIAAKEKAVANGAAKDYAEYREQVGVLRGLHFGLGHIVDLSRSYMEDDDD
jgi:hypothetical protein